uniref:G-protein coupled receptors family 1 profile domain-containing protein n=1 Tax=Maylandia zebra TaxID=106582 RepID=A0A3P9BFL8_9CICH
MITLRTTQTSFSGNFHFCDIYTYCVFSSKGNGLVVCVLVKHRNQCNLTDICLFNLALSDLLFIFMLPFYSHYVRVGQWTFGDFISIFFMVVMTLDRYMIIVHAHRVARYRTKRASIILTVLVWMLSLFVSLPDFIFRKAKEQESQGVECDYPEESKVWECYDLFTTNVLGLVIPVLVMVGCYSRIIPTLMSMRTAKRHLLDENIRLSITVTEALAYTHCCLNPIIYAFVGEKFMRRALQLLKSWRLEFGGGCGSRSCCNHPTSCQWTGVARGGGSCCHSDPKR